MQKNIFEYIEKIDNFNMVDLSNALQPVKDTGKIKLDIGQDIYFTIENKFVNTLDTNKGKITLNSGYIRGFNGRIERKLIDLINIVDIGDSVYLKRLGNKISDITGYEMHLYDCEVYKNKTIQEKIIDKQIQDSLDFGVNNFEKEAQLY